MDFLRDIKRQLVESHREVRERLEDGMRDFLARVAVDASWVRKFNATRMVARISDELSR